MYFSTKSIACRGGENEEVGVKLEGEMESEITCVFLKNRELTAYDAFCVCTMV